MTIITLLVHVPVLRMQLSLKLGNDQ